jgi:hypothetical protein
MDPNTQRLIMGAAGAGGDRIYVEEVFNTYLYAGSGSTPQTLTTNVNLAENNGAVLYKARTGSFPLGTYTQAAVFSDLCWGTKYNRAIQNNLGGPFSSAYAFDTWATSGITLITDDAQSNRLNNTYVAYSFRNADKFFEAYNGAVSVNSNVTISFPKLGTIGAVIVQGTTGNDSPFYFWHRSLSAGQLLSLNTNQAAYTAANISVSGTDVTLNAASYDGGTVMVYAFAHDAGGFGPSGNDSIVKCGTYTGNGSTSGPTVDLGWEPQWLLVKRVGGVGDWLLIDNMRGMPVSGTTASLLLNSSNLEDNSSLLISATASGFQVNSSSSTVNTSSNAYIYIAIRRGPMKTPTDATKVFSTSLYTGTSPTAQTITTNFSVDLIIGALRDTTTTNDFVDRVRGRSRVIYSTSAQSESTSLSSQDITKLDVQNGYVMGQNWVSNFNGNGNNGVNWNFRRAPGFFDVVAYTGTGAVRTVAHNLVAVPEMMIIKARSTGTTNWAVYSQLTSTTYNYSVLQLNNPGVGGKTYGPGGSPNFEELSAQPTETIINLASSAESNASGRTFIAYLFASCPGVSKVGNYTGTGTTLNINCGFTSGARFVLIKRFDGNGDWYVWDTARGIASGNDPYLLLNSLAAEVTGTDYINPLSSGFQISSTAPAAINANGGNFIFLAIA